MACSPTKGSVDHALHQSVRRLAHAYRTLLGQEIVGGPPKFTVSPSTVTAASQPPSTRPTTAGPSIDADAQLRSHAMFGFEVAVRFLLAVSRIANALRARPQRRVLKRGWRAEDCHDAIAREALNNSTLFTHGFAHQLRQAPHERKGRFLSPTVPKMS